MGAVSLGPLVFDADRLSAVLGIVVFLTAATLVSWRGSPKLSNWAWQALAIGIVAARAGHVLVHWPSFVHEPWRAFALWQGGFFWPLGALAVLFSVFLLLDGARLRLLSVAPVAAGLLAWSMAWQLTVPVDGRGLPDAPFATLQGAQINPAALAGKPTVINLWASWCPPCRREMPMMAEMAATTRGVRFVFANQGESDEQIRAFLAGQGPALDTVLLDPLGQFSLHYETQGLPATLFITSDGALRDVHLGEISREVLTDKIARLTGGNEGDSIAGYR